MFKNRWFAVVAISVASTVALSHSVYAKKRSAGNATTQNFVNQDDTFLALRDAALANNVDKAELLAATLNDYDIPSYVDYYRLKSLIKDLVAPQSDILDYLKCYDDSAIADRLCNDWLLEPG